MIIFLHLDSFPLINPLCNYLIKKNLIMQNSFAVFIKKVVNLQRILAVVKEFLNLGTI